MTDSIAYKISTVASLVLAIYGNIRYALGRSPHIPGHDDGKGGIPTDDPFYRVGFTPFTANILVLLGYWGVLHLLQAVFIGQFYFAGRTLTGALKKSTFSLAALGNHLVAFNLIQFFWSLLFAHGHYIWAEIFLIANFFNIVILYNSQRTFAIKDIGDYIVVHFALTALPFSWILYALFWNGAVVVGSNSLAARIVANVFIWDFLLVPGFNLVVYRDWGVGLSSAVIVLGLALGQLFTKLFALQWIFAFIISGLLFLSSIAVWSANLKDNNTSGSVDNENAPLIS